jgi:hypothetical protein
LVMIAVRVSAEIGYLSRGGRSVKGIEVGEVSLGTNGFRIGGGNAFKGSPTLGVLMSSNPAVMSPHLVIVLLANIGVTRCGEMFIGEWPTRVLSRPNKEAHEAGMRLIEVH